ncbi:hypothetical protein BDZ97DRAFT_1701588 [Flammula alnicola]|nr:hypothetical protein BDZ97DRAFT_1701588 [Flammula alnicola]
MQGDSCRFRHSITPDEYTMLFHDQQPNLWTLQRNPDAVPQQQASQFSIPTFVNQQLYTNSPMGDQTAFIQPSASVSSTFVRECTFFPLGKCRNGDRCPYRHSQPPEAPDTAPVNSDQEWGPAPSQNASRGQSKYSAPCKFFMDRGYCNRGDSCRYRHGDEPDGNNHSSGPSGPDSSTAHPAGEEENGSWEDNTKTITGKVADEAADDDNGWAAPVDNSWGISTNESSWGPTTSTTTSRKPKVCYQFAENGRCRRGDACQYSHDAEPKPSVSWGNAKSSGDEWPPTDDSSHSAPWVVSASPCPYYAKGACRKRADCPHHHDPEVGQHSEPKQHHSNSEDQAVEAGPSQEPQIQDANEEDDSWSKPWSTEITDVPAAPKKINAPCKMFGQGYCRFGEGCSYKHIINTEPESPSRGETAEEVSPEPSPNNTGLDNLHVDATESSPDIIEGVELAPVPEPEPEPELQDPEVEPISITCSFQIFDHPVVNRFMMNCEILFGKDVTPEKVTTLTESKKLVLSNLPPDLSPADIEKLAGPYGEIRQTISLDQTAHSDIIQVDFAEADQAYNAFKHLHGREFQSMVISASLKTRMAPVMRSPNQKVYLKVSWPRPSASAWTHYPSITKAKQEAIRLNGVILGGRIVKAAFVTPPKTQKSAFAISLQNLVPDVTKSEVEEICPENNLITMNRPTYSKDATDEIRATFSKFEDMVDFDLLPSDTGATSTAFVTFKNEAAAAEALRSMDSQSQDFLGDQPLTIKLIYYSRYQILRTQFDAIQNELDRLKEKCESLKKCTVQYNDHRDKNFVWVRIFASFDDHVAFADLNTELGIILRGLVVTSDGKEVWDEYFETSSSANALNQFQSNTNTLIHCDHRAKNVKIFGAKQDQEQAKNSILKLLSKVHDLRHEIDLPRPQLNPLVNGAFKNLQDKIGTNKVSLDVISSKLVVRGSSEDVLKVDAMLAGLDIRPMPSGNPGICQICHHDAVNPILLSCRHVYCTACLQAAVLNTGSAPFQCIQQRTLPDGQTEQCQAHVPYIIIRDNLPVEEKEVLRSTFLSYVRSMPDELFFCPSLECQAVYRVREEGVNVKCSLCVTEICTYCKSLAHVGLACSERSQVV